MSEEEINQKTDQLIDKLKVKDIKLIAKMALERANEKNQIKTIIFDVVLKDSDKVLTEKDLKKIKELAEKYLSGEIKTLPIEEENSE